MSYWIDNWAVWVSAFCVLAVYSYLIKDNAVYRLMIQVFIGVNVGYTVVIQWRDILYPRWWLPMLDGFDALFFGGKGSPWGSLWALVGAVGLLWYFQLSRKYVWLSRIVIGVMVGIVAGITFKSQLGQNVPQIVDSFRPLAPPVAAPTPRKLYDLPVSDVPPAIAEPVGYFVSGNRLECRELLNGVRVWDAPLQGRPVWGLSADADGVAAYRADGVTTFDIQGRQGAGSELIPGPEPPQVSIVSPTGQETKLKLLSEGGGIQAVEVASRRTVWQAEGLWLLGAEEAWAFAQSGKELRVLDGATGREEVRVVLAASITGKPAVLRYRDPRLDRNVLAVPTDAGVAAIALRPLPAFRIEKGAVLWQAPFDQPVSSVTALRDVLLVLGKSRGEAWLVPPPVPIATGTDYVENWVFVLTVVSVMVYFFFSFRKLAPGVGTLSKGGRYLLMIGFGAFFGNTVMTRMSFLLDRLMFLVDEWLKPFVQYLFG